MVNDYWDEGFFRNQEKGCRKAVLISRIMDPNEDQTRLNMLTTEGLRYMTTFHQQFYDREFQEGAEPLVIIEQTDTKCPCGECPRLLWKIIEEES